MELPDFTPLEPGTYVIDPDGDPSTPLRVGYEVPTEGWSSWIGAVKLSDYGHIGVSTRLSRSRRRLRCSTSLTAQHLFW